MADLDKTQAYDVDINTNEPKIDIASDFEAQFWRRYQTDESPLNSRLSRVYGFNPSSNVAIFKNGYYVEEADDKDAQQDMLLPASIRQLRCEIEEVPKDLRDYAKLTVADEESYVVDGAGQFYQMLVGHHVPTAKATADLVAPKPMVTHSRTGQAVVSIGSTRQDQGATAGLENTDMPPSSLQHTVCYSKWEDDLESVLHADCYTRAGSSMLQRCLWDKGLVQYEIEELYTEYDDFGDAFPSLRSLSTTAGQRKIARTSIFERSTYPFGFDYAAKMGAGILPFNTKPKTYAPRGFEATTELVTGAQDFGKVPTAAEQYVALAKKNGHDYWQEGIWHAGWKRIKAINEKNIRRLGVLSPDRQMAVTLQVARSNFITLLTIVLCNIVPAKEASQVFKKSPLAAWFRVEVLWRHCIKQLLCKTGCAHLCSVLWIWIVISYAATLIGMRQFYSSDNTTLVAVGSWNAWSPCSKSCGSDGVQLRHRVRWAYDDDGVKGSKVNPEDEESRPCLPSTPRCCKTGWNSTAFLDHCYMVYTWTSKLTKTKCDPSSKPPNASRDMLPAIVSSSRHWAFFEQMKEVHSTATNLIIGLRCDVRATTPLPHCYWSDCSQYILPFVWDKVLDGVTPPNAAMYCFEIGVVVGNHRNLSKRNCSDISGGNVLMQDPSL